MRSSSVQAIEKSADYVAPVSAGRPYVETEQWATVDVQQVLTMLQRRKNVVIAAFAAVVLLAVLYAFTAKKIYESQTTIEISTQSRGATSAELGPIAGLLDTSARSVDTQIAILKGGPLKEKALASLPDGERRVAKQFCAIDVSGVGDTDLVRVSVRTFDRKISQKLADAICREYIKGSLEDNRNEVRGARLYVEGQLRKQLDKLNEAQIKLANFKKANETFDLTAQSQALVGRLTAMQTQAEEARSEKLAALSQIDRYRRDTAGMPDSTRMDQTITRSPEVQAIKAELTTLELELIRARQEYTANDPTIVDLKNRIAALKARLQNRVEFETSSIANVPNAAKADMLQRIAQLRGIVAASESRGVAVKRAMQGAKAELKALPDREYRLGRLIQEASSLGQSYNLLNEQYQTLQIQEQAKVANATVRFAANAGSLVAPKKVRILMLAIPLALILAFLLAAFVDRLDGRVHADSEVESATGLPVMAHIPEISRAEDSKLIGPEMNQANFRLSEAFQMLRTSIAFSVYDNPIRTVLITSSLPGEGKSTCAMNLAIASALSGERVILVDCDLRRPTAHRLMNLPNRVGMTSVVAGNATLEEALQETDIPGLRILSSGPTPPNPYRLLHSRGARELLDRLREVADFVIIDTPPALGMADAQLLATSADAILLVVSTKGARKHEIARTRDLLGQTNVEVLGTILNRVESTYSGYYGQQSYGAYALEAEGRGSQSSDDGGIALTDESQAAADRHSSNGNNAVLNGNAVNGSGDSSNGVGTGSPPKSDAGSRSPVSTDA